MRRQLLAAHETQHDAGAHDEGQDEAVHGVPRRRPSLGSRPGIVIVQEGECQELADQGVLRCHEQCWPGDGGSNDASGIASVSDFSAVPGPFHAPVDGTQEGQDLSYSTSEDDSFRLGKQAVGTYHGAISDLDRLNNTHQKLSGLSGNKISVASGDGVVHFPGKVHGLRGCREVREDTCQTEVQGFLGHILEAESFHDDFLSRMRSVAAQSTVSRQHRDVDGKGEGRAIITMSFRIPAVISTSGSSTSSSDFWSLSDCAFPTTLAKFNARFLLKDIYRSR